MQLSAQWVNTKGLNWEPGDELAFSMPVLHFVLIAPSQEQA